MSTGTNRSFPKARTADLITEQVGDELVVYDGNSSEAHCLSALASAVFVAADGKTSTADLAGIASRKLSQAIDVPAVEQALLELEDCGLIEIGGVSRRRFMQRGALVGGAVVAGSLVSSVVAPAYGTTGSLPSGPPPTGFSSFAVQITCGSTVYGAHWTSEHTGTPDDWGATEANANCPAGNGDNAWTVTTTSSLSGVSLAFVSGGMCVTIPSTCSITDYAVFFGASILKLPGCPTQCFTYANNGAPVQSQPGGCYTISFPAACYA